MATLEENVYLIDKLDQKFLDNFFNTIFVEGAKQNLDPSLSAIWYVIHICKVAISTIPYTDTRQNRCSVEAFSSLLLNGQKTIPLFLLPSEKVRCLCKPFAPQQNTKSFVD